MLRDQKNSLGIVQVLEAKSQAAGTLKSSIISVVGFRGVTFAVNYGVFTPNTAVAGVSTKLQESDTTVDGDFTDVVAEDMAGTFVGVAVDAANDQRSEIVGYTGVKKYVRAVIVVPADSTSLLVGADVILGMGDKPVTVPTALTAS